MTRNRCPDCGVPISVNGGCINASCSATSGSREPTGIRFGIPLEGEAGGNMPESRGVRIIVPDDVEVPRKLKGGKSLLALLGYSAGKKTTDDMRRRCLRDAVLAELVFRKGAPCEPYITPYGDPDSEERKDAILARMRGLIGGMWWVKNDPVKHANKVPEYEKRESDIKWFEETYLRG